MGIVGKNSIIPSKCKYRASPIGGFYYCNELWFSKAYQKLTQSSRNLLHCFIIARNWKGKGKKKEITNNGKISFTEVQYKEVFGSSSSYLKSRNQLIECGFIKQTYRGGMCRGDMAEYEILCLEGAPRAKQRWLHYPVDNWKDEIPSYKKQQVGIRTRWKKGHSGRNSKTTLLKDTLNGANDPIKVYPKNE